MKSKVSGAAILILFLCTARPATAQISQFLNSTTETRSLSNVEPSPATSAILIRVIETNKQPLAQQAVVQLLPASTQSAVYAATESDGRVAFDDLAPGKYTITVSAAGYKTTQRTADIAPSHNRYEALVEMHRDPSAIAITSHDSHDEMPSEISNSANSDSEAPKLNTEAAELEPWKSLGVDQERLVTALGTPCPCQQVLGGASQRAEQLADNINRFDATERLVSEDLDAEGKVTATQRRKFDYVVSIDKLISGDLDVDEFRNGNDGFDVFPDQIATLGLPTLAFIFHPRYSNEYRFTCEGLANWRGHAAWLVYFSQRPDQPAHIRGYDIDNVMHPISLKGRAWIAADTFQVMRMEADIMHPMPKIRLRDEHQAIEYKPVSFRKGKVEMWLPERAEVYFDFRNHRYHRVHSFSDYMLFSVSASEKIGSPKQYAQQ